MVGIDAMVLHIHDSRLGQLLRRVRRTGRRLEVVVGSQCHLLRRRGSRVHHFGAALELGEVLLHLEVGLCGQVLLLLLLRGRRAARLRPIQTRPARHGRVGIGVRPAGSHPVRNLDEKRVVDLSESTSARVAASRRDAVGRVEAWMGCNGVDVKAEGFAGAHFYAIPRLVLARRLLARAARAYGRHEKVMNIFIKHTGGTLVD